jgi:hypothetical protein
MRNVKMSRTSVLLTFLFCVGFMAYLQAIKRDPIAASRPAIARNSENDFLLTQTPAEQASFLGVASGKGCRGTEAFFMGLDTHKTGFWSVRCTDGRSFMITISSQGASSRVVMECRVLEAMRTGRFCFRSLPKA